MNNFYEKQLEKVSPVGLKVKFVSDNGETNYMDLNKDSLKAIIKYFEYYKN